MKPEVGHEYTGPLGWTYLVNGIEGEPGGLQWVVIQAVRPKAPGEIRFPIFDAAKWLRAVESDN